MVSVVNQLESKILSAYEVKELTGWPDAMIEDYLDLIRNIAAVATSLDSSDEQVEANTAAITALQESLVSLTEAVTINTTNIETNETNIQTNTDGLASVTTRVTSLESLVRSGVGNPEGSVSAPVGALFLRSNGGAGTTLYVKESGTGTTGWVGK